MNDERKTLFGRVLAAWTRTIRALSFRGKAVLFLVPTIVVISTVYTLEAIYSENKILRNEIIKKGETIAIVAARNAELPLLSGNRDLLASTAASLKAIQDVAFTAMYNKDFQLLHHDGILVDAAPPAAIDSAPTSFYERPGYFAFYAPVFTIRASSDIDIFDVAAPSAPVKEHIGWVHIGLSKDVMNRTSKQIITRGVYLAVLFTLGGVILVYIFITMATRPLNALLQAVSGLREGSYMEIEATQTEDEIGKLSAEFNKMSHAIKEREDIIVASERRIKSLFERVEHAIFRLDKDGNIIETNKKFREFCGDIRTFCDMFPEKEEVYRLEKAAFGAIHNEEDTIIGPHGTELTVMLSLYPEFNEHKGIKGFDGYFIDITDKRKLEETLIQTQKLESVGLLAGGIAHDFNNILTGVLGYASLMKKTLPQDDKMFQYVDRIEKSAVRATGLTNQLLAFARKGRYRVEKLSINDIVKELVLFLRETFDRKIAIVFDTDENLPPVEGDGNQIYQAMLNLCINARDAMPNGGKLYLKTEFYRLSDEKIVDLFQIPPGEYVRVSVTDTGTGMSPEVKSRIFEPFYTTKTVGRGTGLGLSMVYGIVKNHAGHITVYSEPGLGTTMRIYLPGTGGIVEEKRRYAFVNERRVKATILIIDDEEVVRELGKEILEAYDYRVILAAEGNEGVRLFKEHMNSIDLVVLDMSMPDKSGTEVFKELRSVKADAKVVICSGYGQEQYFQELFTSGVTGFLQKPFQVAEIIGKVEEALERK